ncbi:MAG: peptidoglycan-binding domain-containing protein, partial [Alphaproteobacteria bacterium]
MRGRFRLNHRLAEDTNANEDDTLNTKKALYRLGLYEIPEYGLDRWPDDEMFAGIRDFQKQQGLRVDGVMEPQGSTASALRRTLLTREKDGEDELRIPPPFVLNREVAPDAPLDETDALNVKKALSRLGHYEIPDFGLSPYPDNALFDGLEAFQRRNGLTVDRVMRPNGRTARKLGKALDLKDEE